MTMTDKESVAQLLKETIIQLCKANIFYSGQVEIDGIICISGQVEGQELVIKVHEIFATPQDLRNPYAAIRYQPRGAKLLDFQNPYGEHQRRDLKRRRLESGFDFRPSFAYSYLSKLVYEQSRSNALSESNLDERNGATDLSIKSSLASSNHRVDLHSKSGRSPQHGVEMKYEVRNETVPAPSQTSIHSLLSRRNVPPADGWSPGNSLSSLPHCQACTCSFETSDALSDHNETVHSVFTCLCCFKTFTSRSNLERHSRLHTGHRPYSCDVCGKSFSRKDHLSNHATKHAFKCGACLQRCADKGALISHCLYEHGAVLTNVCGFCNKGFCSAELYEEHVKSHPQSSTGESKLNPESNGSQIMARSLSRERYSCVNCSFETNDKVSLAKHRLVHAADQQLYTCMGCGKIYEDPLQYSDHLILHQKDRDIFECCICHQVCGTLSSLRRHEAAHVSDDNSDTEIVADGDRFHCGECNRVFETLSVLQEHLDFHVRVNQRHSCRSCQKTFDSQADLDSHVEATEGRCCGTPDGIEDCLGLTDGTSRRGKRKQKQPKPAANMSREIGVAGDSDVDVAAPMSAGVCDDHRSCDFVITDNPACVIRVSADTDIKMEPVKSILNHPALIKPRNDLMKHDDRDFPFLLSMKLEGPDDAVEGQVDRGTAEGRVRPTPKHRGRGKGRRRDASGGKSGHPSVLLGSHVSPNGSTGDDATLNNNSMSARNENRPPSASDAPPGPFFCAICNVETDTFQLLDNHCAALHSRSPCMFCSKTFAQKANRDRHHCLHTGDKPYACPECGERFSRGDKLKMHRVRTHGVQYPLYGSRQRESASRGRDFAASPSDFPALQPDGFPALPSVYLAGLSGLCVSEGRDPEDVGGSRASGDVDEVDDRVSEFPRINSNLTKNCKIEKRTDVCWEKTQPKETEIDEENNVLDRVSASNFP